jgi:hypothetical protein
MLKSQLEKIVFSLLYGQVGEFLERLDDEQSKKAVAWITKQLGDKKDFFLLLLK